MSVQVLSAIDVGSNAMRILIAEVRPNTPMKILKKLRVPVRLGKDVFLNGSISEPSLVLAEEAFRRFGELNAKYKVQKCRAVATSASREALNRKDLVERIAKKSKIDLEIINGTIEGELIHKAITHELDLTNRKAMGIDVGGGSVEVTFSNGNTIVGTQSFPLGTVRLLDQMNRKNVGEEGLALLIGETIAPLSEHVHKHVDHSRLDFAIGTGGNLECLGRLKIQLLKKTPNTFVTLAELHEILEKLHKYSIKQRIEKLEMKPDRADVIVPACKVVATIMRQAEVEKILLPGVGLRDGIIWSMLNQ